MGFEMSRKTSKDIIHEEKSGLVGSMFDNLTARRATMATTLACMAVGSIVAPVVSPVFLIAGATLAWHRYSRMRRLPLKMPLNSGLDPAEPNPGTGKPGPAQGIMYLGTSTDNREIWLGNNDCRQHFLATGLTGAAKTESLLGMAANSLAWGQGFTFVDAKGDSSMFARVFEMCHAAGREKDLVVLNFLGSKTSGKNVNPSTHSLNPMKSGNSDSLADIFVSLIDDVSCDGAMWRGRATAMMYAIIRALCWMRDNQGMDLNIAVLLDCIKLKKVIEISHNEFIPISIRNYIKSYLNSLPGFNKEKGLNQSQTTIDQHNYLEMQFTMVLGNLSDEYGHMFNTMPDIDMYDIVFNKRILLVLLPTLQKSRSEFENLGKIVVATLKSMMNTTLCSNLEGTWDDVMTNRALNSPSPYLMIFDDVGCYMFESIGIMAAQARALGISVCYSCESADALERNNPNKYASIIANTNTQIHWGDAPNTRADMLAGSLEHTTWGLRTESIDFKDLKKVDGNATIMHSHPVRANIFYPQASSTDRKHLKLRLNDLVNPIWMDETEESSNPVEENMS